MLESKQATAALLLLLLLACLAARAGALRLVRDGKLPALNIEEGSLTVSGVSGGGAAAIQMHVSHSGLIHGCGIIAAPPYYCAQANVEIATHDCMTAPSLILVDALISFAEAAADTAGSIDSLGNLADDRVWIFTGQKDTVVHPGVVDKTYKLYDHWIQSDDALVLVDDIPAEHSWVTDFTGSNCSYLGSPYINNCNYDASGNMLQHLYNYSLSAPASNQQANGDLIQFEQRLYTPPGTLPPGISLGDMGFLYVPTSCSSGNTACKLHMVFHGCNQDLSTIGEDFVHNTGLNAWADANNIVIVYPQAQKTSTLPFNPQGCFDWWGYSGIDYACKFGFQTQTFANMLQAISGFS